MNTSVNRSSESPHPLDPSLPPESVLSRQSESVTTKQTSSHDEPSEGQHPIPAPSHPRQYRAIGLIQGHYQHSSDRLTRGNLLTPDGTVIDAVILGRVISVLKKHLDLDTPHLWVVYPRTKPGNDQLHLQIVGVWEPETLNQDEDQPDMTPQEQSSIRHGYFSVRGEVIFSSPEKQTVIIKIRQAPKKEAEKPKFFKLKLTGTLPPRPVSRFWDLQVQLQGDELIIQQATDLGIIGNKKPFNNRKKSFLPRGQRRSSTNSRPIHKGNLDNPTKQTLDRNLTPKPSKIIKKKTD